jgi:hypothetical protein
MKESIKNGESWQFSQNWDRRNSSSILPEQNKKPSTSTMNELAAIIKNRLTIR